LNIRLPTRRAVVTGTRRTLVRKVREILDARPRTAVRGSRILVVDDSEDRRILQARVLAKAGCVVLEAADGKAVLGVLEREAVDTVVTDVEHARACQGWMGSL
jgi:PleD family two-component response regulator